MKKILMIALMLLSVASYAVAQTGQVKRRFVMDGENGKVDSCYMFINFKDDDFDYLQMCVNVVNKDSTISYTRAEISENPKHYFGYKTPKREVEDLRNMLDTLKTKLQEWSAVAKENHVTSFSKSFGKKKDIPIFYIQGTFNGYKYRNNGYPVAGCEPMFKMDDKGSCTVSFEQSYPVKMRTGVSKGTGWQDTEHYDYKIAYAKFRFSTPEQIQGLIDALDLETAKQELVKQSTENNKMDSLFK